MYRFFAFKTNALKAFLFFACLTLPFLFTTLKAQLKLGNNTQSINQSAAFEIESSTKGLLPPRMTTAQRNAISNPAYSLMIMNTDLSCLQINIGTPQSPNWQNIMLSNNQLSSGGTAVLTGFNCTPAGASAGTLTVGTASSGVTQTISVTVSTPGSYFITANAAGVTFTGSGVFADNTRGTTQSIVLTANGIPTVTGTTTFVLSTTPGCSFTRDIISATSGGSAVISNVVSCTQATSGTLVAAQPATNVTQTIRVNVTTAGSYAITVSSNGIMFSGTGTVAAGLNQDIVLTASGTPVATGNINFSLNLTGTPCGFSRSVATAHPSSGGTAFITNITNCAASQSGTLTQGVAANLVTQVITVTFSVPGTYSISTNAVNGVSFSSTGTLTTSPQNITLNASGTPLTQGTNTFTLNNTVTPAPVCNSFSRTVNPAATFNCAGALFSLAPGGTLTNGQAYTGSVTIPYTSGNGSAYPATTVGPVNGLTFTRTAGTFAAGGGNVVYTISGTYIGTTGSTVTFNAEEGCSVLIGVSFTLSCGTAYRDGNTLVIPYTGGNGGAFTGETVTSTGTAGTTMTAVLNSGTVANGAGNFVYSLSGVPTTGGTATFAINISGRTCTVSIPVCGAKVDATTWKEFMCHNLGANMAANPFTPSWQIIGNYYQWGRNTNITSGTPRYGKPGPTGTTAAEANDAAVTGWNTTAAASTAWLATSKTANDPCPAGYRVPTTAQINGMLANNTKTSVGTWGGATTNYSCGVNIGSALFLPAAGCMRNTDGANHDRPNAARIWAAETSFSLYIDSALGTNVSAGTPSTFGVPVRCIKE